MSDPNNAAIVQKILPEVKKAIDLWMDKTYNESEFYSHILQIIREGLAPGEVHRHQLERMIFKIEQMRESQRLFHGGHKSKLSDCKRQEQEMDKRVMGLKSLGYSTDRFKVVADQKQMF